jgi:hypothetical protein
MKTLIAAVALAVSSTASAQVVIGVSVPVVRVPLPVIPVPALRFEVAPALVELEPGVQVVAGSPDVFVAEGWYWHRSGGRWFRAQDHRGRWVPIEAKFVPGRVASSFAHLRPLKPTHPLFAGPPTSHHGQFSRRLPVTAGRPSTSTLVARAPLVAPRGPQGRGH